MSAIGAVGLVIHLCPDPLPGQILDALKAGSPIDELAAQLPALGSRLAGQPAYHVAAAVGLLLDLADEEAAGERKRLQVALVEEIGLAAAAAVSEVFRPVADAAMPVDDCALIIADRQYRQRARPGPAVGAELYGAKRGVASRCAPAATLATKT